MNDQTKTLPAADAPAAGRRSSPNPAASGYQYYDLLVIAMITVWLCSNLIGPAKVTRFWGLPAFGAGIFFFPFSYIIGDVLTEVYGYARARRAIWFGFGAMAFASLMSWVVIHLPGVSDDAFQAGYQSALQTVFDITPRLLGASLLAFLAGEFVNSFVLAKLKIKTQGRHLWTRTIGSTVFGQAVDSIVFYPLAFLGIWSTPTVFKVMVANYFLKVLWEVFNTPVVYLVVRVLKRKEQQDYYDYDTNFTPFAIRK